MTRCALVVDDEPDIREIVRLALEQVAGWRVVLAASGEEALALARADPPDVVLLDAMMPGVDGAETARRLAADPRTEGVPVVLLTATVMAGERARLADGPVAGVLAKPFDPLTLAAQVEGVLGW